MVHIHAEGPAFFAWLPKMFGKRVVVTVHGIDWQREKWQSGLGSKFIHQGEKNAAKYADEVIVLSKGVQDYFNETYGRQVYGSELGDEPFLLLNADAIFDVDFNRMVRFHQEHGGLVTLFTHPNNHPYDSGLIGQIIKVLLCGHSKGRFTYVRQLCCFGKTYWLFQNAVW